MDRVLAHCDAYGKEHSVAMRTAWAKQYGYPYGDPQPVFRVSGVGLGGVSGGAIGWWLAGVPGAIFGAAAGGAGGYFAAGKLSEECWKSDRRVRQFSIIWDNEHQMPHVERVFNEASLIIKETHSNGKQTVLESLITNAFPVWVGYGNFDKDELKNAQEDLLNSCCNFWGDVCKEPVSWTDYSGHEEHYDQSEVKVDQDHPNLWLKCPRYNIHFPPDQLRPNHGALAVFAFAKMIYLANLRDNPEVIQDPARSAIIDLAYQQARTERTEHARSEVDYRKQKLRTTLLTASREARMVEKAVIHALKNFPSLRRQ